MAIYLCKYLHGVEDDVIFIFQEENNKKSLSWNIFYRNKLLIYTCSDAPYNTSTHNAQYFQLINTVSVGDNVSLTCKKCSWKSY